jgi:hypothetical protein
MPRTCTVCKHSDREAIDRALLAKEGYRNIAERFGISTTALVRHRQEHLMPELVKAHDVAEVGRAESLLDDIRRTELRLEDLYKAATAEIMTPSLKKGDNRMALLAIREARGILGERRPFMELRGELTGEREAPGPQIVVSFSTGVESRIAEPCVAALPSGTGRERW